MRSVGWLPALALLSGAACGLHWNPGWLHPASLVAPVAAGWVAWWTGGARFLVVSTLTCGFFGAGAMLAGDTRDRSLHTSLRTVLDREAGGFALDDPGEGARHDPLAIRAVLVEDAAPGQDFATLRVAVRAVRIRGAWQSVDGGVILTVGGRQSPEQTVEWVAGRTIEAFGTFRRPSRYLNDGVADFERQLALDGTTLFGSVKSTLLVDVRSSGSVGQEIAGRIRRHVRRSVERWIAPYDQLSAAIVTAVLIGDRTGLPDDVRLRLQAAGTYHVIAISGGNIAILGALVLGGLLLCGVTGRGAAIIAVIVLLAYAQVVTAGASVWRATLMGVVYLCARLLDHRTPPWQAIAAAAALVICARPLDVSDVGFLLTFGATAALLEAARVMTSTEAIASWHVVSKWLVASLTASIAAEVALLPVNAWAFSRVTAAGFVLNLAAVPLMGLVQVSGLIVVILDGVDLFARSAAWVAHAAAFTIVESARLVDWGPWLVMRVPPPPGVLVIVYYASLAVALGARGSYRPAAMVVAGIAAAGILSGQPAGWVQSVNTPSHLRITAFDVGQGDATLVQFRSSTLLVDAAGAPFGRGSFDIGSRVLAPALWARGVRALDALLVTHGDPDHLGGAPSVVEDFAPAEIWEGVPVAGHAGLDAVLRRAEQRGGRIVRRLAGDAQTMGGAHIRVLHPPAPDWERQRVRNDDSVVLEVRYGDAAVLLLGDVGASIEREILPQLTPARVRILKVAHHGSRTSTSRELVEHWRPQIAVISCGRGNTFGHPAPEVLEQLTSIGAAIYRTDLDGQVTIDTDGVGVNVTTFMGRER